MEKENINKHEIKVGEYILAYNTGVHVVLSIDEETNDVTYNQVFTIEGKPVNLNRPATCEMKHCKPAIMFANEIRKKISVYTDFLRALELKFRNG